MSTVKTWSETMISDFKSAKYYNAGQMAGNLLFIGVGPVVLPTEVAAMPPINDLAIASIVAGMLDGFVGDNKLTEF